MKKEYQLLVQSIKNAEFATARVKVIIEALRYELSLNQQDMILIEIHRDMLRQWFASRRASRALARAIFNDKGRRAAA